MVWEAVPSPRHPEAEKFSPVVVAGPALNQIIEIQKIQKSASPIVKGTGTQYRYLFNHQVSKMCSFQPVPENCYNRPF
jgi:hypothetical protein